VSRRRAALVALAASVLGLALWQRHNLRPLAACGYHELPHVAKHGAAPPPVTHAAGVAFVARMKVDCSAAGQPISPLIYGIALNPQTVASDPHQWELSAAARRWGGNASTRYNWELGNAWNTASDWFFWNVNYTELPVPDYVRFLDDNATHHMVGAISVPTMGWVAKDTASYSFPISVYGSQQSVEPGHPDIGNGIGPDGEPLPPPPPERTSVRSTPASIARWVHTIRARDASGSRSVVMYILDNEPSIWNETHRDVHPQPTSYDELLARTVAYAPEIRKADPDALIAGPADWGWPAMFDSAIDKAAGHAHPDRDKHGGKPLLPWWLEAVAAGERAAGIKMLDVVDMHFYPMGDKIVSDADDPDTNARRLRATRSLWDASYVDESWIAEPINLIPRLRGWIAESHPGLRISIGEYNFGGEKSMSGGLAVAEALGRFCAEGILSAFYWEYPPAASPAFWAFRGYRNFDGQGGRFLDESVPATSTDPLVSIFASRSGSHYVLMVLNLDPRAPAHTQINLSSCGAVTGGRAFRYAGDAAGFVASAPPQPGASVDQDLPPYSITVLDVTTKGP
jgi:hypothetical protein